MKNKDIKTIIHRYYGGASNKEEFEEAISLFNDPYHNLELRPTLFDEWNNDDSLDVGEIDRDELYSILDKIHHLINLEQDSVHKDQSWRIGLIRIAAVLIIGILFGFLFNEFSNRTNYYCTAIAPKGSVSQVILPDSSIVFLNSGSKMKYFTNTNKKLREVFLEGEAWFEVSKNKRHPFVVHTPFYDVNVLGTQFNVKAYEDEDKVVTTLERGSVVITSVAYMLLDGAQSLIPGEQLIYSKSGKSMEIKEVQTRIYTSWKDNKLIFVNMSFRELIVLLERKYGIDIEVEDNIVLDYHYDGTIKNESILEILDMIKETLPICYKIEGQKVVIQNRK